MPTLLYTCTSAAKFKEIWLKLKKRRKTCWSDQQNKPVKTSNRVTMGDYILIQSTLFPLIPPLVTVQCHCLGLVNRVTRPHCLLARLQHQPNRTAHPSWNLSEILWHLLQPVLSPSSSLSYHLWTFSEAYQMVLMLTHPHCYMSLISWPQTREEALHSPWVWGDWGSPLQATATTTVSVWNYTHRTGTRLQDSALRPRGATSGIYSSLSHLVKCDGILVAEPELPVASPFLGKVMERCKVASSGMLKKTAQWGQGWGEGGWIKGFSHDFKKPCFRISLCCVI